LEGDEEMPAPLTGCSLSPSEFTQVTAGYAEAAGRYTATAEPAEDRALIDVRGPKAPIKSLLDAMIAREADCCAHLQLVVTEIADGYRVELSVHGAPEMAAATLRRAVPAFFPNARIVEDHRDHRADSSSTGTR
jgi:hypothetical protein